MTVEYTIYCDESESKGRHFSNFYGGALVHSDDIDSVRAIIAKKKLDLNLFGEIKWSKISIPYYKKYIEMPTGGITRTDIGISRRAINGGEGVEDPIAAKPPTKVTLPSRNLGVRGVQGPHPLRCASGGRSESQQSRLATRCSHTG